jgi:hypothetical protein
MRFNDVMRVSTKSYCFGYQSINHCLITKLETIHKFIEKLLMAQFMREQWSGKLSIQSIFLLLYLANSHI